MTDVWRVREVVFLTAVKIIVPLLLLGMVNKDDYARDVPLVFGYSAEERLYLRTTLRENNSVREEILC